MSLRERLEKLCRRLPESPQYPTQGAVLFVDLERRESIRRYLPMEVVTTFLGGRGGNMFLLYNLCARYDDALDPEVPLIFGCGQLTGYMGTATRGNVTSLSPESQAILDSSAGDYFPSFLKHAGYDHLVLFGRSPDWSLLRIDADQLQFLDASAYLGMDNQEFTRAIERDTGLQERKDLAMARITRAGESGVLCSGIMGGPKAIWARGGAGAKMGALRIKAVLVAGAPGRAESSREFKLGAKEINARILDTSVIRNALKTVGTPFLYKPSRNLGAMGTLNNQHTSWHDSLDAEQFTPYRTGMDGCFKCPVKCRPLNDISPEASGGFGADALDGLAGNRGYATDEPGKPAPGEQARASWQDDQYNRGDGPEYVTLGKFGPNIGISDPRQVLRLNNILNDLGLDSASTGGAIAWAMELYQQGIIDRQTTGGLELDWGNYPVVEQLLFMISRREGFGDTLADSARAVDSGKYPASALDYRMAVKGLFQSDPHDSRILKAFALGLAVATRGMDHLRNRATLEINARINDDPDFKHALYDGDVSSQPNAYDGKEYAVRRCEDTYAVGDAIGMCRFTTQLFNSPSLPGCGEFAQQLELLTGIRLDSDQLLQVGRNIVALERLINARRGLGADDDTLPERWFNEPNDAGPFKGEKIDRDAFDAMKRRFYRVSGFDPDGLPNIDWWKRLCGVLTGCNLQIDLGDLPGSCRQQLVLDQLPEDLDGLRQAIGELLPTAAERLQDRDIGFAVNDQLVIASERDLKLQTGDRVSLVPFIAGG